MYSDRHKGPSGSRSNRYLKTEKKYSNPFFKSKKKHAIGGSKLRIPTKAKLISSSLFLISILLVWLILYSGFFSIKFVEARGEGRLDPIAIELVAWKQIEDSNFLLWSQKNLFVFDKEELLNQLNLKYSFNGIIVSKKLPNKLLITFKEKEHSLIWQEKGIYYYTDNQGYIVERIGDQRGEKNYPLIVNASPVSIEGNRVGFERGVIDFVFQVIGRLKDNPEFLIDNFRVEEAGTTLICNLKNGPDLIFNTALDIDRQTNKLFALKNEILKDDFNKKEYIDVRTGDRVYYR